MEVANLRARRGSMALQSFKVLATVTDSLLKSRNRTAKERQAKAAFTVVERPGQQWFWVPDPEQAFVPASFVEETKVLGRACDPPLLAAYTLLV